MIANDKQNQAGEQEAWQVQVARFALLSEVVLLIARTPDLNRLLNQAINKLKWVIDFERCTLALLNDDGKSYHLQTLLETRRNVSKTTVEAVPADHDIPGEVMSRRQMRLITDLAAAINNYSPVADPALTDGTLAAVLSLPLQAYGKMLGAITFSTVRSDGYSDGDIKVATSFATHLALAIDRWQQTQQLQKANEELARLASFPELNPGPIIEVDASCCIHYLNPAAKLVFPDIEQAGSNHSLLKDLTTIANFLVESGSDSLTDELKIGEVWYQRVFHLVAQNQRIRIYASDVTERKQSEEALRAITEGTASATGSDFFHSLVRHLAEVLQVRHAFVTEVTDENHTRVRTLAFLDNGKFNDNYEYDLHGTPCQGVIGGSICYYPDKLAERFPKEAGLESYLGIPLTGSTGNILGHLAVMDDKPMTREPRNTSILQIFAARAGAELERQQTQAAMQQQNEYLAALHDTSLGLISRLDLDELLSALITRAAQLLDTSHGYIYLVESESGTGEGTFIQPKVGLGVFGENFSLRLRSGEGLAGKVWQTGEPLVVDDYDTWSERSPNFGRNLIRAIMGAPLKSGAEVVGVIGIAYSRESRRKFDEEEVELLTRFAQLASIALDNARLFEGEQRQRQMAESLRQVAAILNASLDRSTVLAKIIEQLRRFISYDSAVILLREGDDLVISDLIGLPNPDAAGYHISLDSNSPAVRAFKSQHPFVIADVQADLDWVTMEGSQPIRSWMGIPLLIGEEPIGVLTVNSVEVNAYSRRDIQLGQTFANQAAIAIQNARLFEETQKANQELSHALENLKTTQGQLVEAEKMAALGGLVAGVAHEINTPVGVGVTAASLLEDKTKSFRETYQSGQMKRSDLEKYLDTAEQSSQMLLRNLQRAAELIQSFKQVAVDQSSEERREFAIKHYLEEILLSLRPKLKKTQHVITINGDESLTLDSYPGVFSQIVTNLVMNSLLHAFGPDEAGHLTFGFKKDGKHLVFLYDDDGQGIPRENLNRIFDPFFTTKRGQGGSGLGLHIIYNLVTQKLGGTIRCESEVGQGTSFVIRLPLEGKFEPK